MSNMVVGQNPQGLEGILQAPVMIGVDDGANPVSMLSAASHQQCAGIEEWAFTSRLRLQNLMSIGPLEQLPGSSPGHAAT